MEVVACKEKTEVTGPGSTEAGGGSNVTDNFPLPVNSTMCRYCLQAPCITLEIPYVHQFGLLALQTHVILRRGIRSIGPYTNT